MTRPASHEHHQLDNAHDDDAYFGVPISNYLGWHLCTFTMFLLWGLWTSHDGNTRETPAWTLSKNNQLMVTLAYLSRPVAYILMSIFVDPSMTCVAYDGTVWNVSNVIIGCTTTGLDGMVFIGMFCLVKHFLLGAGAKAQASLQE